MIGERVIYLYLTRSESQEDLSYFSIYQTQWNVYHVYHILILWEEITAAPAIQL